MLRVSDNGIGIDPAVLDLGKDGHFGLQGMRERAGLIISLGAPGHESFLRPKIQFSETRLSPQWLTSRPSPYGYHCRE
jgi:hypothetical protein